MELLQDNAHSWLNMLEHGLADDNFSDPRYFASSAFGTCTRLPPQPHNNYLGPGPGEIAVDKSAQHPGRLYVVYNNRPNLNSFATRRYLTWSDDKGITWSNPISVSDDPSSATKIYSNLAVVERAVMRVEHHLLRLARMARANSIRLWHSRTCATFSPSPVTGAKLSGMKALTALVARSRCQTRA